MIQLLFDYSCVAPHDLADISSENVYNIVQKEMSNKK